MMRFFLLGAPSIQIDGRERSVSSQKALALLFYLAAESERSFTRTQIITLLWEESNEHDGRNNLSTILSRLRQSLPYVPIRADGDTLAWQHSPDVSVDLHEFALLSRPVAGESQLAALQRLESVGALYRGPFLDGFGLRDSAAYDDWLRFERERWQQRALNTLEQAAAAAAVQSRPARAIEHTRRALALDPLQERFHRALIGLLADTGDRAAALAHYRVCCTILERELGVEPDPETIALYERVRTGGERTPPPESVAAMPEQATVPQQHPSGTPRLAARLEALRRRSFVGRRAELQLFADALTQPDPPFLLHISGPGGVGKSSLLAEFARLAAEAGIPAIALDGHAIPPTPEGFLAALGKQTGSIAPIETLPDPVVLLIDTYELLGPIERWLASTFLPQLPERALVVLAGRNPPSAIWRADPAWQTLSRVLRLDDLLPDEAADYLMRRGVDEHHHAAILSFTHGYPLGLSLAADLIRQHPEQSFEGAESPDMVRTLLDRFVDTAPSAEHRSALEAAALVRVLDEALLAALLGRTEAREQFDWLSRLSFMAINRRGLFPHDLAREVLAADLRWRNAEWYRLIHERARMHYMGHFAELAPQAQQQSLIDLIFLHDNPLLRSVFTWNDIGGLVEDAFRPGDLPTLLELIRRHEGEHSALLASGWLEQQPAATTVFRDVDDVVVGFNTLVTLRPGDHDGGDPCVAAVLRYLATRAPLAAHEFAVIDRFWMDRDAYQGVSPAQGMIFVSATRYVLTAPGLAVSFHVFADPDFWAPTLAQVLFERLPVADFSVGGRRYGMFMHDWRAEPPQQWLALLATREVQP